MNIYVLLILIFFTALQSQTAWGVEIFINGIRYPSIESYRSFKEAQMAKKGLSLEDEGYLFQKSKEMGVTYDPDKLKTIEIPSAHDLDQAKALVRLKSVSMDGKVSKVLVDFHQDWNNPMPKFIISRDELEGRLEGLVAGRKNPVLLVAGDHKLRVMELKEDPK